MSRARALLVVITLASSSGAGALDATNVALGKPVTLQGTFFTCGWGAGTLTDPSTVVDGLFLPAGTGWDKGTVWWDLACAGEEASAIRIDLGDRFRIESLVVQGDDNDAYDLWYWSEAAGGWELAWRVPNFDYIPFPDGGTRQVYGVYTRPDPFDDTARFLLPAPIETTALLLTATGDTDGYEGISEIQAWGGIAVVTVSIDVKPYSDPNAINLGSNGTVPVAILGGEGFEVRSIELASVTFAGASIATRRNGTPMASFEDVNADGAEDVVLHVDTQALLLAPDATSATLEGRTVDGRTFRGTDAVRIVP